MKLTGAHASLGVFQFLVLLLLTSVYPTHCTLLELVEAIATHVNASETSGAIVCVFTTRNSTLDIIAPSVLKTLFSKYPTTLLDHDAYIDVRHIWLASLVLLDLTGYTDEFPADFMRQRLNQHPCYRKSAKFIILMGGASFGKKEIATDYLKKYSILNYVIVSAASLIPSTGVFTLYTANQYTGEEHYFRSTDRPVQQFFPDKLHDLSGYRFMMLAMTHYPYITFGDDDTAAGLLPYFVKAVIEQRLNGTTYFTSDDKLRNAMDGLFGIPESRKSNENIFFFWEMSGICLLCPIRTVRDFLSYLLKPFSLGIWSILGGLFVFCRVLEILFPELYRHDLIGITFFGGGGVEYEQPFAFRIVTLTLAVLVFFLSEAYNTKIISLMSLAKYYEQPQTLEAIANSDYRILSTRVGSDLFGDLASSFLSYRETRREERRLGAQVYNHYCSVFHLENAWMIIKMQLFMEHSPQYIVKELLFIDKSLIQLAQNSPFFEVFHRMFSLFNDNGIWPYLIGRSNELTDKTAQEYSQFQEIIFFFDDLFCVWILIAVGWAISAVCFVGEIVVAKWRQRVRRNTVPLLHPARKYRLVAAWFGQRKVTRCNE